MTDEAFVLVVEVIGAKVVVEMTVAPFVLVRAVV